MPLETLSRSPETLAELVERCVQSRTSGRIRGLRVDWLDGSIILTGRTTTYYSKQLATQAAFDVAANLELTNDIEVC